MASTAVSPLRACIRKIGIFAPAAAGSVANRRMPTASSLDSAPCPLYTLLIGVFPAAISGEIGTIMTSASTEDDASDAGFESAALEILETLAARFPVCMSSDEFHFFPQARPERPDWTQWDRFSEAAIADTLAAIGQWTATLGKMASRPPPDSAGRIEAALLQQVLTTIASQLSDVGPHRSQPTFYLTVAAIGLAEALETGPEAFHCRIKSLPGFLSQALSNLGCIPSLFRDLGLQMNAAVIEWLCGLAAVDPRVSAAIESLRNLEDHLKSVRTRKRFRPEPELYGHIARRHMDCRLPLEEIRRELQREIDETEAALRREARRIEPGTPWRKVLDRLPRPDGDPRERYANQIGALGRHCLELGLVSESQLHAWPVQVEPIPAALQPVRSGAAYSMPPVHPPRGGTFFISGQPNQDPPPADYRMLTAHETFPGHHLLDSFRWNHGRRVRRHIEFPIFYEGWASFAEEILLDTGFFSGAVDRFLLAKRRYWRAVRGMVDLELNSGRRSPEESARLLSDRGMSHRRAAAMIQRYALKPGYQLAYTIGRRKFRRFYSGFTARGNSPADFVRRVLDEGEIGLENLEALLFATIPTSGRHT